MYNKNEKRRCSRHDLYSNNVPYDILLRCCIIAKRNISQRDVIVFLLAFSIFTHK